MATHYRGERIDSLLRQIAESEKQLNAFKDLELVDTNELARGYMTLALAKAKLTSLQGGNYDQEGKKSR